MLRYRGSMSLMTGVSQVDAMYSGFAKLAVTLPWSVLGSIGPRESLGATVID